MVAGATLVAADEPAVGTEEVVRANVDVAALVVEVRLEDTTGVMVLVCSLMVFV